MQIIQVTRCGSVCVLVAEGGERPFQTKKAAWQEKGPGGLRGQGKFYIAGGQSARLGGSGGK